MKIIINTSSMVPIYEQIVAAIKMQISDGTLVDGDVLPSVRILANQLKISALTVKKAYDRLEAEGYVVTVHGKGTYVAAANLALGQELRRKQVEDSFAEAVGRAKALGLRADEIMEIMIILLENEPEGAGGNDDTN